MGALVLALPGTLSAATAASTPTKPEAALLQEMNRVRAQHGLPALHFDARLARAARAHNEVMFANDVFTHGAFVERMRRFGVRDLQMAENLAWAVGASSSARDVVAAWLASPEHRRNLLGASYHWVGISDLEGTFLGYGDAVIVTADFAG